MDQFKLPPALYCLLTNIFLLIVSPVLLTTENAEANQTSLASQQVYHVTKDGSAAGDGTIENPWSIEYAFDRNNPTKPNAGDKILIHQGTYITDIHIWFGGDANSNVLISNYQNDKVIIDGNTDADEAAVIYIQGEGGGYVTIDGLTVTNSNPIRTTDYEGSFPPMPQGKAGIFIAADNCIIKNNIIRDNHSNGLSVFAGNATITGNMIFYNGWDAPDRSHAYGLYVQNGDPLKNTYITHNFIFSNFNKGFHVYVTKGDMISNIHINDNIIFESGSPSAEGPVENNIFVGGLKPLNGIEIKNNHTFLSSNNRGNSIRIGYYKQPNTNILVEGNYATGGKKTVFVRYTEHLDFRNNFIYSRGDWNLELTHDTEDLTTYTWDNNRYYYTGSRTDYMNGMDWNSWLSTYSFDETSRFSAAGPPANEYHLKYVEGYRWASLVIYDFIKTGAVEVDLSKIMSRGSEFSIYDAQNLDGPPVLSDTYPGGSISVPTTKTAISPVFGTDVPQQPQHTPQEFQTFVIEFSQPDSPITLVPVHTLLLLP